MGRTEDADRQQERLGGQDHPGAPRRGGGEREEGIPRVPRTHAVGELRGEEVRHDAVEELSSQRFRAGRRRRRRPVIACATVRWSSTRLPNTIVLFLPPTRGSIGIERIQSCSMPAAKPRRCSLAWDEGVRVAGSDLQNLTDGSARTKKGTPANKNSSCRRLRENVRRFLDVATSAPYHPIFGVTQKRCFVRNIMAGRMVGGTPRPWWFVSIICPRSTCKTDDE